jgi:N-acetylneuraminic acid mutarotase
MKSVIMVLLGFMLLSVNSVGLAKNDWTKKADMPTARWVSTCVVNGKIYAIGGYANDPNLIGLSAVEEYDPKTDTWTEKPNMPTPRLALTTCAVDGKIYAIGGYSNGALSIVEEYDPVTDKWTKKANMPSRRHWLSSSAVNGKIYVIGGAGPIQATVEEYDPKTDTWTKKANMPTARFGSSAGVANGKIYVFGGSQCFPPCLAIGVIEEYDPVADKWTKKADMPRPRGWISDHLPTVNEKIYVIGGWTEHDLNDGQATVEEYDPTTDTWVKKADMPTPRGTLGISNINGKIYAIGGSSGWGFLSTVEEYDTGYVASNQAIYVKGSLITLWGRIKTAY